MEPKFTIAKLKFSALINSFFLSFRGSPIHPTFSSAFLRINTRWKHIDLILRRIDEDIILLQSLNKNVLTGNDTRKLIDNAISAPSLDIETFFAVVRSLLDDIAVLTPFFYGKESKQIPRRSLSKQRGWFIKNTKLDPKFSKYMEENLNWFVKLKDKRDSLIHHQAEILPINSSSENPNEEAIHFYIMKNFSTQTEKTNLKLHISEVLINLVEFLDFYSSHFRNNLPLTFPQYNDSFGENPKGGVIGLENIKKWVGEEF